MKRITRDNDIKAKERKKEENGIVPKTTKKKEKLVCEQLRQTCEL